MALLTEAEAIKQLDRLHQSVEIMKAAMELYSDMMTITEPKQREEYTRKYERAKRNFEFNREEIAELVKAHPLLKGSEKARDLGLI